MLVVEDDHDARVLIREALEDAGYEVHTATNGRDALAIAESLSPPPRLILVDLRMPVMDGWDLIARLKSTASLAAIPVGVQTAEVDRTLPGGVSFVLGKPIDIDALMTLVRHHCS